MDTKKAEKAILKKLQSRLKLVIVGDGCVGKTSLLFAYGAKQFLENHEPTVFENYVTTVQLSNKKEVSGEMVYIMLISKHILNLHIFLMHFLHFILTGRNESLGHSRTRRFRQTKASFIFRR